MNIGRYAVSSALYQDLYGVIDSIHYISRRINDPELNQAVNILEKAIDDLPRTITIDINVECEKGVNSIGWSGKTMSLPRKYY